MHFGVVIDLCKHGGSRLLPTSAAIFKMAALVGSSAAILKIKDSEINKSLSLSVQIPVSRVNGSKRGKKKA